MAQRLREVLYFFRANLLALLAVTLPFAALASFAVHIYGEPVLMTGDQPQVQWNSAVVILLLYPLALGVKLVAIHRLATGAPVALGPLLLEGLRLVPVLAGISLVTGVVVGFGLLVLFIIPGAWFYARLGYAPILAVTEQLGFTASLAESWRRSREQQFDLFMFTLLFGAVLVAVMVLVFHFVARADAGLSFGADLTARAINELLFCLLTLVFYRYGSLSGRTP